MSQELGRGLQSLASLKPHHLPRPVSPLFTADWGLLSWAEHSTPSPPPGKHRVIRMACFEQNMFLPMRKGPRITKLERKGVTVAKETELSPTSSLILAHKEAACQCAPPPPHPSTAPSSSVVVTVQTLLGHSDSAALVPGITHCPWGIEPSFSKTPSPQAYPRGPVSLLSTTADAGADLPPSPASRWSAGVPRSGVYLPPGVPQTVCSAVFFCEERSRRGSCT